MENYLCMKKIEQRSPSAKKKTIFIHTIKNNLDRVPIYINLFLFFNLTQKKKNTIIRKLHLILLLH